MAEQRWEYIRRIQKRLEKQLEGPAMPDDDKLLEWSLLEVAAQLDEIKLMMARTPERKVAA